MISRRPTVKIGAQFVCFRLSAAVGFHVGGHRLLPVVQPSFVAAQFCSLRNLTPLSLDLHSWILKPSHILSPRYPHCSARSCQWPTTVLISPWFINWGTYVFDWNKFSLINYWRYHRVGVTWLALVLHGTSFPCSGRSKSLLVCDGVIMWCWDCWPYGPRKKCSKPRESFELFKYFKLTQSLPMAL